MTKDKKIIKEEDVEVVAETVEIKLTSNDLAWTDYVLSLLSDDEKISGNPTTDGLRRIFEIALNCRVIASVSDVVQTPEPNNEKRATVVHSITYVLNEGILEHPELNTVTINGAADVFWGNCDKIYRNYPVAVAETRAEGRALRRALKLRKVVAAEEIAKDVEEIINFDKRVKVNSVSIDSTQQGIRIEAEIVILPFDITDTLRLNFDRDNTIT